MDDVKGKIQKIAMEAREKLVQEFGFAIDDFELRIAETRPEYEKLLGRKTEAWQVASAQGGAITILSPIIWEKEGFHRPDELNGIVIHEVAHLFTNRAASGKRVPMWLNEGLSGYFSGQYQRIEGGYFFSNFTRLLDTSYNFTQHTKAGIAYSISYLFVAHLIKNFGLEKIKILLGGLNNFYYYERFNKQFKEIFKITLPEAEKDFLESLS